MKLIKFTSGPSVIPIWDKIDNINTQGKSLESINWGIHRKFWEISDLCVRRRTTDEIAQNGS